MLILQGFHLDDKTNCNFLKKLFSLNLQINNY